MVKINFTCHIHVTKKYNHEKDDSKIISRPQDQRTDLNNKCLSGKPTLYVFDITLQIGCLMQNFYIVIVDAKARACSGPGAIDGHNGEGLLCQFGGRSVYLGFLFGYGIWGFIVACFCDEYIVIVLRLLV